MADDKHARQESEWMILHDRITKLLDRFGKKDAFRKGDYWVVDDNWGWQRQQIEIQNLSLLSPQIINSLQGVLSDFPGWTITVRVDVPGTEQAWPAMGLIIRRNEIVDQLQRGFLPDEFAKIRY